MSGRYLYYSEEIFERPWTVRQHGCYLAVGRGREAFTPTTGPQRYVGKLYVLFLRILERCFFF